MHLHVPTSEITTYYCCYGTHKAEMEVLPKISPVSRSGVHCDTLDKWFSGDSMIFIIFIFYFYIFPTNSLYC